MRARGAEEQALWHNHRAAPARSQMLHHQREEEEFALFAVGGQVGANRVLRQLPRKGRIGDYDFVAPA